LLARRDTAAAFNFAEGRDVPLATLLKRYLKSLPTAMGHVGDCHCASCSEGPLLVRYRRAKPTLRNDLTTPDKFRPQRKAGPRAGLFAPNEAPQHDIVISDYLRLLSLYFV